MKKFPQFFSLAFCFTFSFIVVAQPEIKTAQQMVDAEQKAFKFYLDKAAFDENIRKQLLQFAGKETPVFVTSTKDPLKLLLDKGSFLEVGASLYFRGCLFAKKRISQEV